MLDPATLELNPRRKPDFNYATSNTLRQSISATGVVTDYTYESNTIRLIKPSARRARSLTDSLTTQIGPVFPWKDGLDSLPGPDTIPEVPAIDSMLTIGIRLKSITQTDCMTGRQIKRDYTYAGGICNIDLLALSRSDFMSLSGLKWFYMPNPTGSIQLITVYDTSSTLLYGSRLPGAAMESARIYYGKVTESISGTGLLHPLLWEYEFDLSRCMLTRIEGGREMSTAVTLDGQRSLVAPCPVESTPVQFKRMTSHIVRGYFREHIGAAPELTARTSFRWDNGEYLPYETERRHYITSDSMCIHTSLHYEPLVRDIRKYVQETITHDLQNMNDVSCFDIRLEASSRLMDSVAVTHHYADGSLRLRTSTQIYAGLKNINTALTPDGHITIPVNRLIPDVQLQIQPQRPWLSDSITTNTDIILPVGEIIREGGHTMEHHTVYSCMVSGEGFSAQAAERGLQTLPLREMWIMDGCDTLHRQYDYALFAGAAGTRLTHPVAVTTTVSGSPAPVDVHRIHSYTPYGRPLAVTQTGRPQTSYEWGYGGDLPTAVIAGGGVSGSPGSLRSEYDWEPLVGCTAIRLPSGKSTSFDYTGSRLHTVSDGAGHTLTQYDYELHADTPGPFAGRNRITATSYLLDTPDGSATTRLLDGFSLPVAEMAEGAGGAGEDVVTVSRYDAIGRPVAQWLPMVMNEDAVADAMKRDTPLQQAAGGLFGDAAAYSAITYPGNGGDIPATATLSGSDFDGHPQLSELTCSNPADPARKVVRWQWDGSTLRAAGFYGAGELDAVRREDGDGRVTLIFTDCLGRQVLQRSATGEAGRYADTYTVSDPWGNPLVVLPPEASRLLGSSGSLTLGASAVADLIDKYAYVYRYDTRLRLRSKKLPGCEPVMYAYDRENRLIFTRDGNQAQSGRRSFLLYDRLGRDVVTGTCRDALSDDFWLPSAPDMPASSFDCTGDAVSDLGALSTANPQQYAEARLLTATYYDDYNFLTAAQQSRLAAMRPAGALTAPKGLPTGTLTAVLGPDGIPTDSIAPMLTVNYYDAEERVIATATVTPRDELLTAATSYTRGGLPVTTAATLTASGGDTPAHAVTVTSTYDRHGRVLTTQLSRDGAPAVTIASNTYDRLGRLQSTAYHGGMRRTYAYDMHGWLTGWHCGFLGQQLLYAGGTEPSYTGRVSSKTTNSYGHFDRYDYSYDRLGRLTSAAFSRRMPQGSKPENGDPEADFSTAYSYDLQGNILSLTRQGLIAPGVYGQIDDITATFSGNQLLTLRDDAPTVLLEASLDLPEGAWSGSDFAYDANGNQTRDMSRGVSDVTYNVLNLPQRVEFASGARIDYLYSASGTKLAEIVYDTDGALISRRDYVGQFEFVADTLERTLLPEGFITAADSTFHVFIPDYQGNIVGVYNSATNSLEQFTDYYPYGLPHASATAPTVNRRKYGAKELTTDHGLNLYDFAARFHNPAFPAFTTPDPLAEKYHPVSPYLYCGGDPINLVDPTGMKWRDEKDKQYMMDILNSRLNWLNKEIEQVTKQKEQNAAKNKPTDKQDKQIEDLNSQIEQVNQAISDVNTLDEDPNNIYGLMEIDKGEAHKVIKCDGIVYIQYSDEALIFHEAAHIRQNLKHRGYLEFSNVNEMVSSKTSPPGLVKNELESYRIQYSIKNSSLPYTVSKFKDINIEFLTHIWTPYRRPAYDYVEPFIKLLKKLHPNDWKDQY